MAHFFAGSGRYNLSRGFIKKARYTIATTALALLFLGGPLLSTLATLISRPAQAATTYNNGFEANTNDWTGTTRVGSGTNGIPAGSGGFYGQASSGAFTRWDGYENAFPANGYTTSLDVYLDMTLADGSDKRFDFSSAINNPAGAHRRDFVIHLGTNPTVSGQWAVSASNTVPGWPLNPARSPQAITETGWYTIKHEFKNNGSGVLTATVSLTKTGGTTIGSWVLSDSSDVIGSTVGGHRYGWFTSSRFDFTSVAIDNASLTTVPVPSVAACTTTSTIHTTDLSAWDLSQTRATGHNELVNNGLRAWTEGTTSTDKAAGYRTTNFALEDAGVPDIQFASFTGGRPSLQLGIDKDANGSRDAYLVYEPWAYGDGKYWATAYLGVPAGMGYASFGTLNDFLVANPSARIVQIGYSLGSGVLGDAVISKLTAGCVDYTFERVVAAPTLVSPANNAIINASVPLANDWSDVAGADHYIYQSYNVNSSGNCNLSNVRFTGNYTDSQTNSRSIADGLTFCWRVKTVDDGLESEWSELWKVTIDNTAPTAPSIVSPINNQYFKTTPILNDWTNSSDTNGIQKYQIEYVYDDGHTFSSAPYRETAGNQSQRNHTPDTTEQGGVKIRVRAYDNAGNTSAWSDWVHYYYDATAPTVPINGQPHNTALNTNNFSFTWGSSTDASPITYEFQSSLSPSQSGGVLNSGVWKNTSSSHPQQNPLTSPAILSVGAPDGTWYWQARAVDAAGNTSAWSEIWNVTLDTQAPAAPALTASVDGSDVSSGHTTNVNGVLAKWNKPSSDTQEYQYQYWNDIVGNPYKEASPWQTGVNGESRFGTFTEGEGTHYIRVRAIDAAGNQSSWSNIFEIVYDITAPAVTVTSLTTVDTSPELSGTIDDPTAQVSVVVDGNTYSAINNGDGTWTLPADTIDDLPVGTYEVTVTATDGASNVTTTTRNITINEPATLPDTSGDGFDTGVGGRGAVAFAVQGGAGAAGGALLNGGGNLPQNNDGNDNQDVLGTRSDEDGSTLGTNSNTGNIATANTGGFNFGWLWWLLLPFGLFLLFLLARRKNQEDEA